MTDEIEGNTDARKKVRRADVEPGRRAEFDATLKHVKKVCGGCCGACAHSPVGRIGLLQFAPCDACGKPVGAK